MKTLFKAVLFLVLIASLAVAQTTITNTTLSAAVTQIQTSFSIASATGVVVATPTILYVDNEAMLVTALSGTSVGVQRGYLGTFATAHKTSSYTYVAYPSAFTPVSLFGSCAATDYPYSPVIKATTGERFYCTGGSWSVPYASIPVATAVASAAGLITPSGALFHITGTAAITGFTLPAGFTSGYFCVIPDGAFTTTNANNIAIASTGVVSKVLCWTYDPATTKFYPSY